MGILIAGTVLAAPADDRPNILIFVADDLGWNDVGWMNPQVKTPHLDRLCREGVRLNQHYVASMCTPTRVALLTGRFPTRFGISVAQNERALPWETVTLASALRGVGYDTAISGKWHLGSSPDWGPTRFGFDHSYGVLAGGCGPYTHAYKAGPYAKTWHREDKLVDEEGHATDLIAADAVKWLESRTAKPFFLYVPFTSPHVPVQETEDWLKIAESFTTPAKREYYASIAHMDDAIGKVMAALERSGKRDNTLILFTSDNGATPNVLNEAWLTSKDPRDRYTTGPAGGSNHPLRGEKTTVFEGGIRVPAFIHFPARLKAGEYSGVMHAVDWLPTLARLAGYRAPANLQWDGKDMWKRLAEGKTELRELYWASARWTHQAVREGDWKLIVAAADRSAQLFNLANDPNERSDLAKSKPDRVGAMRKLLTRLAARDNDARVSASASPDSS